MKPVWVLALALVSINAFAKSPVYNCTDERGAKASLSIKSLMGMAHSLEILFPEPTPPMNYMVLKAEDGATLTANFQASTPSGFRHHALTVDSSFVNGHSDSGIVSIRDFDQNGRVIAELVLSCTKK